MWVEVLYSFFCLRWCQLPSRASSGLKWILMGALTRLFHKICEDMRHNNDAVLRCGTVSNQITENRILSLMTGLSIYFIISRTFCNLCHCPKILHPKSIFRVRSSHPLQAWTWAAVTCLCFSSSLRTAAAWSRVSYCRFQHVHSQKQDQNVRKMSQTAPAASNISLQLIHMLGIILLAKFKVSLVCYFPPQRSVFPNRSSVFTHCTLITLNYYYAGALWRGYDCQIIA